MPERESSIINAVRIYLLAAVIGYETGVPASAFHYCLEKAFHLHEEVAALSSGSSVNAVLVAALLGAAITAIAVIPVRGFAPEAAGNGIQEIEGVLQGLRNIRIAFEKVTTYMKEHIQAIVTILALVNPVMCMAIFQTCGKCSLK